MASWIYDRGMAAIGQLRQMLASLLPTGPGWLRALINIDGSDEAGRKIRTMRTRARLVILLLAATMITGRNPPEPDRSPDQTAADRPSATSPAPTPTPSSTPTPSPTPSPADDARQHSRRLMAAFGRAAGRCPEGAKYTDLACGRVFAAAAKRKELVDAALDEMPKGPANQKVADAVAQFRGHYKNLKSFGCYSRKPAATASDYTCQAAALVLTVSWANVHSHIDQFKAG